MSLDFPSPPSPCCISNPHTASYQPCPCVKGCSLCPGAVQANQGIQRFLFLTWNKEMSNHPLPNQTSFPRLATSFIQYNFGWIHPLHVAAPSPWKEVALLTFSERLVGFVIIVLSYFLSGSTLPGCCIGTFLSSLGCCGLAVPAPQKISRSPGVCPWLRGIQREDALPMASYKNLGICSEMSEDCRKAQERWIAGRRGGRKKGRLRGYVTSIIFPDETRKKSNTAPIFSWKTPCSSALKAGFSSLAQLKRFLCCFKENVRTERA